MSNPFSNPPQPTADGHSPFLQERPFDSVQRQGGAPAPQSQPPAQPQPEPPKVRGLDEAVGGGSTTAAFTKHSQVGDVAGGPIVDAEVRQRRDFKKGTLLFWEDGNPQEQVVIRVQAFQPTPDDDGVRGIFIKTWGSQAQALREAIKDAGFEKASDALRPGNEFWARFASMKPTAKGDDEKIFEYKITPGGGQPQAQPQAQPVEKPPF